MSNPVPQPQISPLITRPAVETTTLVDELTETDEPIVAHIVKVDAGESAAAKVLDARIYGTPIEALCGSRLGAVTRPAAVADVPGLQGRLRHVQELQRWPADTPDE